jgi:hypothetical protein
MLLKILFIAILLTVISLFAMFAMSGLKLIIDCINEDSRIIQEQLDDFDLDDLDNLDDLDDLDRDNLLTKY